VRIIIIDNTPVRREFLIKALVTINPWVIVNEVPTWIDGLEGFELEFPTPPNYIFMDVLYAKGKKCLKIIRNKNTLKDIPIIMLSSITDYDGEEDCFQSSNSLYLVKTSSFRDLVKMLRMLGINPLD
jgi:DNA-binding NarL/FixJ family response regulator